MRKNNAIAWTRVCDQTQLEWLTKAWQWQDAFIESLRVISKTSLTMGTDGKPYIAGWGEHPDIEISIVFAYQEKKLNLRMTGVDRVDVWFGGDLCPAADIQDAMIFWRFNDRFSEPMTMAALDFAEVEID